MPERFETNNKKQNGIESLSQHDRELIPQFLVSALGLDNLSQLYELKDRIKKYRGMVRVFVHPFFEKKELHFKDQENYDKAYVGAERHLVASSKVPLIIFEEFDKIERLGNGILAIPTELRSGAIYTEKMRDLFKNFDYVKTHIDPYKKHLQAELDELEHQLKSENFGGNPSVADAIKSEKKRIKDRLDLYDGYIYGITTLQELFIQIICYGLGIQQVVAGGMYIRPGDDADYSSGCLGDIVGHFKKAGVKVKLSRYHLNFKGKNTKNKDLS